MDYFEFVLGVLILILAVVLLTLENRTIKKIEKGDYMRKSFRSQIFVGIFAMFLIGLALVYRSF
jgi:hypothetical protein